MADVKIGSGMRGLSRSKVLGSASESDVGLGRFSPFRQARVTDASGSCAMLFLPAQPTRLIGREAELLSARDRLLRSDVRLLTMTGLAGMGKTRLAVALAASVLGHFPDGILFLDLAPTVDPSRVPPAIAQALGIQPRSRSTLAAVKEHLRDKQILLLLDNLERLLPVGAQLAEILAGCPHVTIVATSREPLRLRWEHLLPVPPLQIPSEDSFDDLSSLAVCPSVELFLDRARAVSPAFQLNEDNARSIAEVCTRLDGIPLAIELAAAESDVLLPGQLASRLRARGLASLRGGPADLPSRQQTLVGAVDSSYALLAPEDQRLLRWLAVFRGGCSPEAAREVGGAGGSTESDVSTSIVALARKSLLRLEDVEGQQRLRLLEMVREYAEQQLTLSGEAGLIESHHADYYVRLAEEAESQMRRSDEPQPWLARLSLDHDNFRQAIDWLYRQGRTDCALQVAGALGDYWRESGRWDEGQELLEGLLRTDEGLARTTGRATALIAAGKLAGSGGDYGAAASSLGEAAVIFRETGDRYRTAVAMDLLAAATLHHGQIEKARRAARESIRLFAALDDSFEVASSLVTLALIEIAASRYRAARSSLEESLALKRKMVPGSRLIGTLQHLGYAALEAGDQPASRAAYAESLTMARERHNMLRVSWALDGFALLSGKKEPRRTVRLASTAHAIRESIKSVPDGLSAQQVRLDDALRTARQRLGEVTFRTLWHEGRSMEVERAVLYALQCDSTTQVSPADEDNLFPELDSVLSARETTIAGLIARGLTNRQIGSELVLSERTVDTHVGRMLRKLALSSRSQVAVWAAEKGLLDRPVEC